MKVNGGPPLSLRADPTVELVISNLNFTPPPPPDIHLEVSRQTSKKEKEEGVLLIKPTTKEKWTVFFVDFTKLSVVSVSSSV